MLLPHNGSNIKKVILDVANKFSIGDSIISIALDNVSSNTAAVQLIREDKPVFDKWPLGGTLIHTRCMAHILNLLVQNCIAYVKDAIEDLRRIVKKLKITSEKAAFEDLRKDDPVLKKKPYPGIDVKTRWNSTYEMINKCIVLKKIINKYMEGKILKDYDDNVEFSGLSEAKWKTLETMSAFLKPFSVWTHRLCITKIIPNIHFCYQIVDEVWEHICNKAFSTFMDIPPNSDDSIDSEILVGHAAETMMQKCNKYFGLHKLPTAYKLAHVLDPRNKLFYVKYCDGELGTSKTDEMQQLLEKVFREHYANNPYVVNKTNSKALSLTKITSSSNNITKNVVTTSSSSNISRKTWQQAYDNAASTPFSNDTMVELEQYLRDYEHGLPIDNDETKTYYNVLEWWRAHQGKYPRLALDYRNCQKFEVRVKL